jgi:hypothetical protein
MEAFKAAASNADGGVPYAGPSAGQNVISKLPRQDPSQVKVRSSALLLLLLLLSRPEPQEWIDGNIFIPADASHPIPKTAFYFT